MYIIYVMFSGCVCYSHGFCECEICNVAMNEILIWTWGYRYVTAANGDLNKQTPIEIFMVVLLSLAPCVPDSVTVVPSCEDNGATVTWGHSPVATSYLLTATGRDGHVASCNTSVNNCTLADLHCGQPYSLSITASEDNCTSQPSTSSFRTGTDIIRDFCFVHFIRIIHSV